jgi:hypothetical protein
MALSPQYSWPEPDNSSLVKNGAQDIRALGDAIDTSVWNVGYGQAGKNKVINGDFGIWQRGTSFSNPTGGTYTSDRWRFSNVGGAATSHTIDRQTFTPGTAPVAGYEGTFFLRSTLTTVGSSTGIRIEQRIEDVRTFAGQSVTLSFWCKSDTNRTNYVNVVQVFGSGGSAAVDAYPTANFSATSSWQRFTFSFTMPSISGKTIGTNSYVDLFIGQALTAGCVMDVWGVQLEYGSKATPFQTATGTIQGELAACQRYYYRLEPLVANSRYGVGFAESSTLAAISIALPVQMRVRPSALEQSGTAGDYQVRFTGIGTATCSSVPVYVTSSANVVGVEFTVASGLTAGQGLSARSVNTSGFLGWSAEL